MEYLLKGNTYEIKEDLKAHACRWNPEKKAWITPNITKDELSYKALKKMSETFEFDMIPVKLSEEAQKIQDILG